MDALDRLRVELHGCGLNADAVATACEPYERALRTGRPADWERFYRALFAALAALRTGEIRGSIVAPVLDSVLRILEDDLGAALFGSSAVQALRRTLLDPLSESGAFNEKAVSVRHWPRLPVSAWLAESGLGG